MNTPERNEKKIAQMQELGRVYSESEEDLSRNEKENSALENATREYPLPTARRFAWVMCGGFWLFCLGGLLFGVDMRALFPFMFIALAVLVVLYIPVFFVKKKILDVIIGSIFAASCIITAVSLMLGGR